MIPANLTLRHCCRATALNSAGGANRTALTTAAPVSPSPHYGSLPWSRAAATRAAADGPSTSTRAGVNQYRSATPSSSYSEQRPSRAAAARHDGRRYGEMGGHDRSTVTHWSGRPPHYGIAPGLLHSVIWR